MSRITAGAKIDLVDEKNKWRFLSIFLEQVRQGWESITFDDNFNAVTMEVTFSAANTDTSVKHNLGRNVSGYLVQQLSAAMIVYDGSTTSDLNTINLKASAVGTAVLLVY